MIAELKTIANEIANARVRLSYPALEDRISEVKNLENLELRLREIISEYEIKIKELLE